jgi:Right handed beta helix region
MVSRIARVSRRRLMTSGIGAAALFGVSISGTRDQLTIRSRTGKPLAVIVVIACLLVASASIGQSAEGAPSGDSTAALQAEFDQLKTGETLTLEPGTYQHSGIIYIRVPGVRINGNGATLQATNDPVSAVWIGADNVSVSNLNLTAPQSGPRYDSTSQHKLVVGANGATLSNITITGSAGVGVFVGGVKNFRLDRVTVRDTRADGIQISAGASDGQVNDSTTERTGDDGFAILSYTDQLLGYRSEPCRNIVVNSPVVNGTRWARGIVVAGGENISIRNIKVSQTSLAGVFIASVGGPFYTQSTNGVEVSGGSVTGANVTPSVVMGAVEVSSDHGGYGVTNATISSLTITDTSPSAQRNIAIDVSNGGTLDNVALRNIRIQQSTDLPAIYSNAPGSYTASGITLNGRTIDSH